MSMKAAEILAVQDSEPERLFPNSLTGAQYKYYELMKEWHVDVNKSPDALKVSQHITKLYQTVKERIATSSWRSVGTIVLHTKNGKACHFKHREKLAFDLGETWVGDTKLYYVFDSTYKLLFSNGYDSIMDLKFADTEMAKLKECLPLFEFAAELDDGRWLLVLNKPEDAYPLRLVLNALGGHMDPRHVAWIMTRLHNLACYLNWAGITHNAISVDNCFISPSRHLVMLYGGWSFSAEVGQRLTVLPRQSIDYAPLEIKRTKLAKPVLDHTLIRVVGRELLGDITGTDLTRAKAAPQPMIDYLRTSPTKGAIENYTYWTERVLKTSFGARRFVKLELTASDIYRK